MTYRPLPEDASRAITVPPGAGTLEAGAGQEQGGDKEGFQGGSGSSVGHGGADNSGSYGGAGSSGSHGGADRSGGHGGSGSSRGHGGWASVALSRFPDSATMATGIWPPKKKFLGVIRGLQARMGSSGHSGGAGSGGHSGGAELAGTSRDEGGLDLGSVALPGPNGGTVALSGLNLGTGGLSGQNVGTAALSLSTLVWVRV